ncbi:DUF5999 family protein [Actinoplanes sp. CA-142083]|uniref:DUF5999 family protein n=1 Tax=Actinoplanes sp. CA-142083 TaxID=3239903 RepID=UPI003D8F1742
MCDHHPECPPIDQPGWDSAHVLVHHAELGWSMLCNGAIVLDAAARPATLTPAAATPAAVTPSTVTPLRRRAPRKARVPLAA